MERGLAPSLERAQALILAGRVVVGETRVDKPSEPYAPEAVLRVKGPDHPFVSRGGVKLASALDFFKIAPSGKTCLDVGASTGGFTDCLLQRGAGKVFTLDAGTNQLDFKLRTDPRVVARENFNVRYLKAGDIPEKIDLIVLDVSFISLKFLVSPILENLPGPWDILMLIKPQFEASKGLVGRGGVVRDLELIEKIVTDLTQWVQEKGLQIRGTLPSPLKGEKGNQEHFLAAHWNGVQEP